MKQFIDKAKLKDFLGELPLVPELYWHLRQPGKPVTARFTLDRLQNAIPVWLAQTKVVSDSAGTLKKVFVFATLRYWVEQAAAVSLALAGQGNQVTLAFLPYAEWQKPISKFDLRKQNAYTLEVLSLLKPFVNVVSFLDPVYSRQTLPEGLDHIIQEVSYKDTQYTLQQEQVNVENELYILRLDRNRQAAKAALKYLKEDQPDVVIVPNGTILEFGAVYQTARWSNIPAVTYEFGEQRQRLWLAQNNEVMRQDTSDLWKRYKSEPLTSQQLDRVRQLFASRQSARLYENFARRWQGAESAGGDSVRSELGLDNRPIVLLATNVIGDSLTLGRQVFSDSMTEWLQRTTEFFCQRADVQFIIRIHPGELVTKGPSVADVVTKVLASKTNKSEIFDHIHLIPADASINTYDLVEIADLGLVYTTTVGLEMAMSGVPVMVVGNTHYRGRGFTIDPMSWDEFFNLLSGFLGQPGQFQLTESQVNLAWNYAYRFFFNYPLPFPWHIVHFWDDIEEWSFNRVLSNEGQEMFSQTFNNLVGEPIKW